MDKSTDGKKGSEAPLRFAVIGLGKMGVMHSAMCHAVGGAEVVALMDVTPGLGSQVQSMGVKAPFFTSLDAMFEEIVAIDAAVVATPQFTHRAVSLACLEKGLHVFCEKPLANTLDDARAMAQAAQRHPKQVTAVGFMKGHDPMWREAARRVNADWIGKARRFRAGVYLSQVFTEMKGWTFTKERAGGGILINSGIHLIHFLRTLFGNAVRVTALMRSMHSNVEDTLTALVEYENGVFGSVDMSWSVPGYSTEGTTVFIEGDEGTFEITDHFLRTWRLSAKGDAPKGWSQNHRSEFDKAAFNASPDYGGEGFFNEMLDFAQAIREGRPARIDWQEGLRVQEVVDAIYRSAESRQPVEVSHER